MLSQHDLHTAGHDLTWENNINHQGQTDDVQPIRLEGQEGEGAETILIRETTVRMYTKRDRVLSVFGFPTIRDFGYCMRAERLCLITNHGSKQLYRF